MVARAKTRTLRDRDEARKEASEAIKAEYLALRDDYELANREHMAAMDVERRLSAKKDRISKRLQAMEHAGYLVKEEL